MPAERPTPLSPRITTRDVALRAGVSQPTVSLVLGRNPRARIAPETRDRVLRAAEELGYQANIVARGLTRGRSFSLGLLVPDLRNPFFVDVVAGAERVASEEGYAILLCECAAGGARAQLDALRSRLIDGVIIDAAQAAEIGEQALRDLNVVIVDAPAGAHPTVVSDSMGAGRLAAEHLLALGHRRIACIGPASDAPAPRLRERGFVQALRAAAEDGGVPIASELLRRAPATAVGGQEAMRALLALNPRPTAVFCVNDLVAVGALKACSQAGVKVPTDCSIVGCDDIELARLVTPELTTVNVPAREMGARAARLLIRRLTDPEGTTGATRALPVKLMVRGTTAAVRTAGDPPR